LKQDGKGAEIVADPDGKVIEAPEWGAEVKKAEGKAGK
jgi:hypothetical protein